MLVDLNNLKTRLESEVQTILKSKSVPEILGFNVVKGPWEKTFVFNIETTDAYLSGLLLDIKDKGLDLAGPFKVTKKEEKKK